MSNPTANPLGAGGDITKAAEKIRGILSRPEPSGQPAESAAPAKANQPEPTERPRTEQGRFTKSEQSEPQTVTEDTTVEGADVPEPEAKAAKPSEPSDDHEELADDVDGLAKQLGMEPGDLLEHLKAKVKVNGEERTVNLKELIAGHQMEADYRQKTAAIAEQRKAADAERTAYQQQREHISSQLQPLVQQLEGLVQDDNHRLKAALDAGDILEVQRIQFETQQRQQQLELAKREQSRIADEKQREQRVHLERHVADQEAQLLEYRPEWGKDVEKGRKELTAIREYLKAEGVPAQQADSLYEASALKTAHKAMLWDALQKAKPGKLQEVKSVPKFQKPGPAKAAAEDPKKTVLKQSLNRLRKTGDYRDAAKVFKAMGHV